MLKHVSTLGAPEVAHGSVLVLVLVPWTLCAFRQVLAFPGELRGVCVPARWFPAPPSPRRSHSFTASKYFAKWTIGFIF